MVQLAKLAEEERLRILEDERLRREAEARQLREEQERRRQEEEMHRLAQEALEREREEEEAARAADESKRRFRELRGLAESGAPSDLPSGGDDAAGAAGSTTGFKLDMGRVTGAAQKAAELEPDMAKWTPRARPKDAPKQSARYQTDFKALPEDVLEYAVYLGMEPTEDTDLLWIAEEALTAGEPEGWTEQMDPNGNLYYYNATTGQSSRQHPLDEYYQNLYLKLKMQRTMEVAGMAVPDEIQNQSTAQLTTKDLKRMCATMAVNMKAHRAASPPPPTTVPWVCSQCTLENVSGASVCAACAGPGPVPPPAPRVEVPPVWDVVDTRNGAREQLGAPQRGARARTVAAAASEQQGAPIVAAPVAPPEEMPVPEGLYDPAKYAVSAEIKELFQHITRYKAHNIELETRMRPFIPDYIPAVGDIDPFIKIPRPDGKTDNLGLVTLDEPASVQSDPTVLTLQLRAVTKCARALPTALPTVDPPAPPRPIARALSLLWSTAPQLLTGAFPPPPYRLPQVVGRAADARALGGTRREGPEGHHRLDQLHLGPASAQARAVGALFEADARYREPDADMAGPHRGAARA